MTRRSRQTARKPAETAEQIERRIVAERAAAMGISKLRLVELVPVVARIDQGGERGGGKTVRRLDEIGKLVRGGFINKRQFDAAEHFAERYQTGGLNAGRAQNYGGCGGGSSTPCLIPDSIRAVAARRQLDTIRSYLGHDDERLLIAVCVMGQSIGARDTGAQRLRHANRLACLCKALDRVAAAARL
mgnify:CR=1 FL=1